MQRLPITDLNRSLDEADWTTVSTAQPCPACGSFTGCSTGFSNEFACCSRRVSDWPLTDGGWLHRVQPGPRPDAAPFGRAPSTQ